MLIARRSWARFNHLPHQADFSEPPVQELDASMQDIMEEERQPDGEDFTGADLPNSVGPNYTRVPNNLIGKLLGYGKVSAYAVHLLAIKCGRGDGYALNLTAVNKPANAQSVGRRRSKRYGDKPVPEKPGYGVGERGFQQGLALMKKVGVLERSQPTRRFAREKLIGAGDNYVRFDDRLLHVELADVTVNRSMLIAFILTVNLSPEPMPPADAARRFGVASSATIRKLWQQAVRFGAVAKTELAHGKVMVARRGYVWVDKNVGARNVQAKNVSTHSNRENNTEHENFSQQQESHYPDRARHDREATPSMPNKDDIEQEAWTSPRLLSWADADEANSMVDQFLDGAHYCDIGDIAAVMPDSELRSAIEAATDGRVHPAIVAPAGLHAVRILATCLVGHDDSEDPLQALQAVLAAIRLRIGDRPGQRLNSLELIGMRLAGQVYSGDWAPADQFYRNTNGGPSAPDHQQARRTRTIPRLIADFFAVDHAGVLHDDLQSVRQHDVLRRRVRECGEELVETTIKAELARHAVDGGELGKVRTWTYFDGSLKDARHAVQMQASGIRPGDVFGWWRQVKKC